MANNIQIVGNIVNSSTISRYSSQDTTLLTPIELEENFGDINDYIEYYVYDAGGNLLNINYDYRDFKLPSSYGLTPSVNTFPNTFDSILTSDVGVVSNTNTKTGSLYPIIEIDPVKDLENFGYTSGEFKVQYNFFTNKISNTSAELFIKEISSDRTEISVISTTLTNEEIENEFNSLINEISTSEYFTDYLLNFGDNQQILSVNIALNRLDSGYEILFKLYEPLPNNIVEKTQLWVVDEKVNPYIFDINLDTLIIAPPSLQLRGPNFNIPLLQQGTISTTYQNQDQLLNNLQSIQSSSYTKLLNLLNTQSIDINVDYTNFSEFSFFGSVEQRLQNFYTKIKQIEDYNTLISSYTPYIATTSSLALEITSSVNNINSLISQFDGFEYYLYFESSSYTWPKTTSTLPYILASTSSATTWYNNQILSSSIYDSDNVNNLQNSVPSFIIDDPNNNEYLIFLNMIGQYFDNIWIFLKAITDINLANNNLEQGVSKDLVYYVLKSYGVKLYNSQGGEDLNQFLIGSDSGSVNFDNDFSPTGSYLNNIPKKDLLSEIYKRIYHNLPYLVKNKGTVKGIEGLINTFGITGSVLYSKEYGGGTKSQLLKGYNNDKVRIVDNNITGSVLSSFIPLQSSITSSLNFIDDDLHYLDISFSPQSQIDTYVSMSISSSNPSFSLDDYIGDPRQEYSGSYPDLIGQRDIYFAPFTGSYMDYNGFIRLIQFFDNALFKMMEDFIPARTNLSTGITIDSPVLERNKVSYAKPLINNQEILDAEYNGPTITPQYGDLYNNLSGDKSPFYTGQLSGSEIDIYNSYFEPANFNPYLLGDTGSYNSRNTIEDHISLNRFNHSEYNVLLNNVSSSLISKPRRLYEPVYGTTSSVLSPVQLQDSYLSLHSYQTSRYEGSKLISLEYNTYTSSSYTSSDSFTSLYGDKSYGKTAVIDHYVRKIGLFTQIESSSFLPLRNNVTIKYLVDEFGNLTELNQQNKHWEEIQNTFKANNDLNVSLFDNKKFGNQKLTEGNKDIFDSGYSYYPILYATGSCPTDELSFENLGNPTSYLSSADNSLSPFFITGSNTSINQYDLIPSESKYIVSNLFDNVTQGIEYFSSGGLTINNLPSYSVQETSPHKIKASFGFNLLLPDSYTSDMIWKLEVLNGNDIIDSDTGVFNIIPPIPTVNVVLTNNLSFGSSELYVDGFPFGDPVDIFGTSKSFNVPVGSNMYVVGNGGGTFVSIELLINNNIFGIYQGNPATTDNITVYDENSYQFIISE
jgi:hypothetical protein